MGWGKVDPAPLASINTTRTHKRGGGKERKKRRRKDRERQQTGRETEREREKPTERERDRNEKNKTGKNRGGRRKEKERKRERKRRQEQQQRRNQFKTEKNRRRTTTTATMPPLHRHSTPWPSLTTTKKQRRGLRRETEETGEKEGKPPTLPLTTADGHDCVSPLQVTSSTPLPPSLRAEAFLPFACRTWLTFCSKWSLIS